MLSVTKNTLDYATLALLNNTSIKIRQQSKMPNYTNHMQARRSWGRRGQYSG